MSKLLKSVILIVLLAVSYLAMEYTAQKKVNFVHHSLMVVIRSQQDGEIGNNLRVLNLLQNEETDTAITFLESITKSGLEHAEEVSGHNQQVANQYQDKFCSTACLVSKEDSNAL